MVTLEGKCGGGEEKNNASRDKRWCKDLKARKYTPYVQG